MPIHATPELQVADSLSPMIVAVVFILACSLLKEPSRRNFMAIMIGGAGVAFAPIVTYCAYKGLGNYRFIGAGWLLHTTWDVVHHFYGTPIVPFVPTSSAGCAICDVGIALWCFADAPSAYRLLDRSRAAGGPVER